jgi:hypothetical protein
MNPTSFDPPHPELMLAHAIRQTALNTMNLKFKELCILLQPRAAGNSERRDVLPPTRADILETWVGGPIFVESEDAFLCQLRDNRPEALNPNRVCVFGGKKNGNEMPAVGYRREILEELSVDILHHGFTDFLRCYIVDVPNRGKVIRCVFALTLKSRPEIHLSEGAGWVMIPANRVLAGESIITALSLEDMRMYLNHRVVDPEFGKGKRYTFRLDVDVFGAESDEPYDMF